MPKPYADIPGFKKLDAALRDALVGHKRALDEIASARCGRRTKDEMEVLAKVEATTTAAMELARQSRNVLWEGVV